MRRGPFRVPPGATVRVPKNKCVRVEVTQTNTLLFDVGLSGEYIEHPDIAAVQSFLGSLGPYMTSGAKLTDEPTPVNLGEIGGETSCGSLLEPYAQAIKNVWDSLPECQSPPDPPTMLMCTLSTIQEAVQGAEGVENTGWTALESVPTKLAELAPPDVRDLEVRSSSTTETLVDRFDKETETLVAADTLRSALPRLPSQYNAVFANPEYENPLRPDIMITSAELVDLFLSDRNLKSACEGDGGCEEIAAREKEECKDLAEPAGKECEEQADIHRKDCEKLAARARKQYEVVTALAGDVKKIENQASTILKNSQSILTGSTKVEAFARIVAYADGTWHKCVQVPKRDGIKLTVKATRRTDPELIRYSSDKEDHTAVIAVVPSIGFRPSVGLSFLWVDDAIYPEYGTKEVSNGFEIVQASTRDARAQFGLTMGVTYASVDHRHRKGRWALWLPELMVSPSTDDPAFGAGVGVSWRAFKLSVGGMWVRHKVLVDQSVGEIVGAAGALQTRDSYGSPQLYFGVSLIGWPPFVKSD